MNMKKLVSLMLALVMVLAMAAVPAFAVEEGGDTTGGEQSGSGNTPTTTTYSIKIENSNEGHTYEAYQIFTGTLSTKTVTSGGTTTTEKVLSDVKWGANATTTSGDVPETTLNGLTIAQAQALVNFTSSPFATVNTQTTIDGKKYYVLSGLPAGYYLVKDKDNSLTDDPDAYTEYIIKVVENVTTEPKSDVPTVTKKVQDINDSTDSDGIANNGWMDSADHDINDNVPFQLTGTLPDNYSAYTTYKYIFTDTLSNGLTYNGDAKVYVVNGNDKKDVTSQFTINPNAAAADTDAESTLTISCDDLKQVKVDDVAIINANSSIVVEYTAKLNEYAVIGSAGNPNTVNLTYSNNPQKSGSGDNETGKTPDDTVVVFTYKTVVNKVTTNPAYDADKDPDHTGTDSDGDKEYPSLAGAAFKLEKQKADGSWELVDEFTITDDNTRRSFAFEGLDDGTYKLTETATPTGYNSIDPITFKVEATHTEGDTPALTELNGTEQNVPTGAIPLNFERNTDDEDALTAKVVNNSGSTLPETGGIGTTIFYVVGSVLLVGAAVVLITKRRMGAEK